MPKLSSSSSAATTAPVVAKTPKVVSETTEVAKTPKVSKKTAPAAAATKAAAEKLAAEAATRTYLPRVLHWYLPASGQWQTPWQMWPLRPASRRFASAAIPFVAGAHAKAPN